MIADRYCRHAIEAILLVLALGSPWALAGTYAGAELAIRAGTALVLVLWGVRALVTRSLPFRGDLVLAALGGLTLLTALQLVPLPAAVLRTVSPSTLATNDRLRPDVRERLPGEPAADVPRDTAFPISLSPPDTRDAFGDLFAITLLYAAARSNLAGPGPLVRLAWAAAVNAGAISAVGIAQLLSSPPNLVFWTIPTDGQVFGPFVNRNHFPFYAAVGLGFGAGLLANHFREGLGGFLNRPTGVWLLTLVALTGLGVVFSHSRGGVVAGLTAAGGCLLVWFRHSRRATGLGWALWVALAVAAVGSWIGWSSVTARLDTLEAGRLSDESRLELWAGDLRVFARFPALGTGTGTHLWVEPAERVTPGYESMSADHAHNEYVEALIEGGVVRLALTLVLAAGPIAALVGRHRRAAGSPEGALLLGGLFAVLAVAAHSFVDFGVHLPAVAVLGVVTVAALMGSAEPAEGSAVRRPLLAVPAALALVVGGGLLVWDGLTADTAERSRWASRGLAAAQTPTPAQADRAVRLMEAACRARPHNAQYRHELGQAYLARALARPARSPERAADLREALRAWREARDLSPVMAPPHARLGRYRDLFESADPAVAYLERARSLLPIDPEMAYLSGLAQWEAGNVPAACADWKSSLANSERFLPDVLGHVRARLGPDAILRDVLPDHPDRLLRAADTLFPDGPAADPARREYLQKARDLVAAKRNKSAHDWELAARLERGLGDLSAAVTAYQRALAQAPRQTAWRTAYAGVLRDTGDLDGARRELETVVAQEPGNKAASDQLDVVVREIQIRPKS